MDCESEYHNIVVRRALADFEATDDSRSRYSSKMVDSNVSDATVRIAATASAAKAALLANLLCVSPSSLVSMRMRAYPLTSIGGRAPKVQTRPSFQP